jgi:hypothetical protein
VTNYRDGRDHEYDPTLDLDKCRADVAWLRASGVKNAADQLEALLNAYTAVRDEHDALRAVIRKVWHDTEEVLLALSESDPR